MFNGQMTAKKLQGFPGSKSIIECDCKLHAFIPLVKIPKVCSSKTLALLVSTIMNYQVNFLKKCQKNTNSFLIPSLIPLLAGVKNSKYFPLLLSKIKNDFKVPNDPNHLLYWLLQSTII